MRYEDASGTFQASGPIANDDADTLAAGSRGPATGNLITGEGTQYGAAGADSAAGAHVAAIAGKGGEDSSFSGGRLSVGGEHGQLSVDAEGNYSYLANKGAPENVRDRFTYTLADNQGNTDTAALIVEIGKTPVVIKADAQQIVPGPDGVVTLPPGVELSDVHVVGRNLVVDLPDGTQLVIIDGAVFVPQLTIDGVSIPATNVAALLIGQEPQPAAGETPPSSGGNFALPPPPLDPGVPLGDLIPPTEYDYTPPEPQEVLDILDREPTITIQPDGQPASVAAVDSVDEAGLPERNEGEPEGSGEEAAAGDNGDPSEATSGVIHIDSPDGPNVVTINGVAVTAVGQVFVGEFGTLVITSISDTEIGYSYTLGDNTSGDATHDDFSVSVTDNDGDVATATLTINIVDDVPTARNDTDATVNGVATGNVMTDAAPGDVGDSDTNAADTVGADNATLTAVSGAGGSDSTFEGGFLVVNGQFGALTIDAQGNYTYTVNPNVGGGGVDVFTYTLTDGDGDTTTATLTITNPDLSPNLPDPAAVLLDDDALANGNPGGTGDDVDSQGTPGQLQGTGGDGDLDYFFTGANSLPAGFSANLVNASTLQILQGATVVLTITLDNETGAYSVVQNNPIDHPAGGNENNLSFGIGVEVEDADGDTEPATITINVDDDTPELGEVGSGAGVDVDETDAGSPAGFPISDTSAAPVISATPAFGADGPAAVNSVVYGLAITGGPGSGLQTAQGNFAITLVQIDGDTIQGQYQDGGTQVAFTIQMNADGTVTLTQNVPLEHLVDGPPGPAHNDTLDLGGLINATITITDGDGDTATASAQIGDNLVFFDDGPSAANDTDTLPGGSLGPATGNVITDAAAGDAGDGDNGADDAGADGGAAIVGLASNNVPANVDNDPTGGFVVAGQFGTLTMQADGSYSYVRNDGAPGNFQDVFTYTLTDADGDTATATLTIDISDAAPQLATPAPVLLDDDALAGGNPGGTGDDVDSSGTPGQLVGSGGDGDLDYFFSGSNTLPAGFSVNVVNAGQIQILQGATVVLTITLDNETGAYSVVQNNPIVHPAGLDENNVSFSIGVLVQDADGDTATSSLSINVDDDTPVAANDTDSLPGGSLGPATGNVITDADPGDAGDSDNGADSVGADGGAAIVGLASNNVPANVDNNPAGGFVVAGQFGTLTMQADGSYSYTRNDGTPGNVQDVFTYTLTDADGDTTTATLTISIEDAAPQLPDPAAVLLDDDALAGGNPGGTGDDVDSSGTPGQLVGSGGDGDLDYFFTGSNTLPAGFSVNVVNAGQIQILQGATVVLTVTLNNETGAYTVVQNNPILHPAGSDENNLSFLIGVEVQDVDGDAEPATITINVDDDTPVAANDTDTIASGSVGPATGNVITDAAAGDAGDGDNGADSVGADGGAAIVGLASNNVPANVDNNPAGGFVVAGQFGTLTMQADGSYSYARNPGEGAGQNDVFTYTLTDADGDTTTATLTISIADATPTLPDPAAVLLDDDALAGGNPGGTGDDVDSSGTPGQLVGSGGDGDLDYFFTGSNTLPAGFSVNVVNAGQIQILQGATVVLTVTLNNETGSYTVVQNNPILHPAGSDENNLSFLIGVEVQDVDGDAEPATITINVDDDTPVAANDTDTIASGSVGPATGNVITDADPGDAGDSDTGADSVGADGGAAIAGLASNNVPANVDNNPAGGFVVAGQYGTLTMQADGSYSYTRAAGTPGGVNDVFTYTLTDADGDTTTATLTISIADATPTLPDPAAVLLDDDALAGGNPGGTGDDVDSSGTPGTLLGTGGDGDLDYAFTGSNTLPAGFTVNVVNAGQIQILQGATVVLTVTLNNETGGFTVVQNNPIDHAAGLDENNTSFSIGVQVVDVDGDTEPATITINVDDDTPVNFTPVSLTDTDGSTVTTQDDALVNDGSALATRLINDANNDGTGENFIGADGFGSLTFTATGHVDGEQLENAGGTPLTSGGDPIYVYGYGTGTLTASTSSTAGGITPANTVFTVTLNPNAGYGSASTYTIDFNQTIDNGAGVTFNNLTSAKAGNVDVRGVGADDPATTVDLLLTASGPGGVNATINTDSDSVGSGNQSMDEGETVRIDFVTNLEDDPNDDLGTFPSGFSYDGHVGTNSLLQAIPQVQGSQGETVAFRVYALNTTVTDAGSPDDYPGDGFSDSSIVTITKVTIDGFDDGPNDGTPNEPAVTVDISGVAVGVWTAVAYGVFVQKQADGSVIFTGVQQGDQYGIETGATDFNAVAVTSLPAGVGPNAANDSSTNSFDLGVFSIGQVDTGDPIDLSFDVTATDGDGDTSSGTIDVTLLPDTSSPASLPPDPQSFASTLSTESLLASDSQEQQVQKTAANSNTLTLAAAVAAAGFVDKAAAHHGSKDNSHGDDSELTNAVSGTTVEQFAVADDSGDAAVSMLAPEPSTEEAPADTSSSSSASSESADNTLDNSPAQAAAQSNHGAAADDHGPAANDAAVSHAAPPTVAMPSAEALIAAGLDGEGQEGSSVEQVLADALGQGAAPTVDGLLAGLPGGLGSVAALGDVASPTPSGVPGWDMADLGAFGAANDMMIKVDAMHHPDAVQPAVNG